MRGVRAWLVRLAATLTPWRRDRELADELNGHLDFAIDEYIRDGMRPDEARRRALIDLGGMSPASERCRERGHLSFIESFLQDLRHGARMMRRSPGFTAIAIITLALGVGANGAIFQLIEAVQLRPLPVGQPNELMEIRIKDVSRGRSGNFMGRNSALTNPLWEQIRDRQQAFSSTLAWGSYPFDMSSGGEMQFVQGLLVSGSFFEALQLRPLLGRLIAPADDRRGCGSPVAVISYEFWLRQYAGASAAIGRTILLERQPFEVVGVAPRGFHGVEVGRTFDVAVPICAMALIPGERGTLDRATTWWLSVLGRLKPDWSSEQASADLASISAPIFTATLTPTLAPDIADHYRRFALAAFPASTGVSSTVREKYNAPLSILMAISGCVLLIACANIANMLFARATNRTREIAVRMATGASRFRVARQLLTESLLLGMIGTGLGIVIGRQLSVWIAAMLNRNSFSLFAISFSPVLDWRFIAFTTAIALLTCLLFGLAPALRATGSGHDAAMKATSRESTDARDRGVLRRVLVVGQLALSFMLVVSALLFVRTFRNLNNVDTGFRLENLAILSVDLRHLEELVPDPEGQRSFRTALAARISQLPGVRSSAIVRFAPIVGSASVTAFSIDGTTTRADQTYLNWVSPEYFTTMGIGVVVGRGFTDHDGLTAQHTALVNRAFADQYFAGGSPLGHSVRREAGVDRSETSYDIVGMVDNSKYADLREPFRPIVYFPDSEFVGSSEFDIAIRAGGQIDAVIRSATRSIADLDPRILVYGRPLQTEIDDAVTRERMMAKLSGLFAGLAVLLAIVGLYGVMSYGVARRTGAIGVRVALGASPAQIAILVFSEAALMIGLGLGSGLLLALASTQTMSAVLFDVQPNDVTVILAGALLISTATALACCLPAIRAARLDPVIALRHE